VRALLDFGRQLGESDHSAGGQAMRSLLSVLGGVHTKSSAWAAHQEALSAPLDKSQVLRGNAPEECHDRGAILVAAVVEAFLTVFERRARTIRRLAQVIAPTDTRGLPSELVDLLVELVLKIADQFLRLIIRAVDYCPPVDLRFGDYLRALITADTELVPDDPHDYRGALVRAFRRRGVEIDHVLDMSTQSLLWADASMYAIVVPELAFSRIKRSNDGRRAVDQNEMQRWAHALGEKVCDEQHIASFGLRAPGGRYSEIVIESLHVVHRIGPEGHVLRGMIAEIVQTYRSEKLSVSGGCTVHLNENGLVRYIIRKRADSVRRRKAISTFLRHGEVIDFKQVHAKRGLAWGR
jgi:hypothetical protein